jgi:outer membrane receptor protein involved in Fe transport
VENLFDKKYQDVVGYPALRRNYRAGIRWVAGGG